MSLDDFKSDQDTTESNSIKQDIDKHGTDIAIRGNIVGLDDVQKSNESDKHYNTKINISLKLSKVGYHVYIEPTPGCLPGEMTPDIVAFDEGDVSDSNKVVDVESFTVEVGGFTANRAKKQLGCYGCVVWVDKGDSITDGMLIDKVDVTKLNEEALISERYINSEGDEVEPDIDSLVTEKSIEIALEILLEISDFTDKSYKDVTEEVNKNRPDGYDYKESDVKRVLDELNLIV